MVFVVGACQSIRIVGDAPDSLPREEEEARMILPRLRNGLAVAVIVLTDGISKRGLAERKKTS